MPLDETAGFSKVPKQILSASGDCGMQFTRARNIVKFSSISQHVPCILCRSTNLEQSPRWLGLHEPPYGGTSVR